jgi:hypothetical protein
LYCKKYKHIIFSKKYAEIYKKKIEILLNNCEMDLINHQKHLKILNQYFFEGQSTRCLLVASTMIIVQTSTLFSGFAFIENFAQFLMEIEEDFFCSTKF